MKTKQIKGKLDILLVDGLPEHKANEFKFGGMWLNMVRWKYISTIEDITEFEADLLMEEMINKNDNHGYKGFGNFDWLSHAVPAFHSLLSANDVITDRDNCPNRFCVDGKIDMGYGVFLTCSICEDDNIFYPSTTLIFVKE